MERVRGIEPPYAAWKAAVLPLNYTRFGEVSPSFICCLFKNQAVLHIRQKKAPAPGGERSGDKGMREEEKM